MKTLIFLTVLVALTITTWLFIPLLQGRDADFEIRLALLQGRGGDFVATPSEATPTPPSQAPGAAPSRALSGPAESVEAGGAAGKAAETSIGEEPGDRPSTIENGQTREPGQKPLPLAPPVDPENDTAASATDAVPTQQGETVTFLDHIERVLLGHGYEHFQKGFAVAKDGRQDLAIDHYTRAIESGDLSQEHLAYTFSNRGVSYWAKGLFDRAIEDLDEAIRLKPDYAHAYHNRGRMHEATGRQPSALQDFQRAYSLDPSDPNYRAKMKEFGLLQ